MLAILSASRIHKITMMSSGANHTLYFIAAVNPEVEFVHPVSAGGSVKFVASGVSFSNFSNLSLILCVFSY